MAKNLFEQLLTKANEIWSGPKTHHEHQIYRDDNSGQSGVAKYLAKQEQSAKPIGDVVSAQATGVEKYLAKKQGSVSSSQTQAKPQVAATGVGKYLAQKATSGTVSTKETAIIPKTGVGKYLAGLPVSKAPTAQKKQTAPAASKPQATKASTPAKKAAPAITAKAAPAKAPAPAAPKVATQAPVATASAASSSPSTTAAAKSAQQCQASTTKGTQCKNTIHLTKIQRTINKKKYQFSACLQHNNESFKPFAPLLESK